MRPLSRPMFRYGGPIKEGVMSGIREPKKNGGSMREAQQWNTVGSPAFPKDSSGRAHHLLPAGYAIGAGLNALRIGAMRLGSRYLMPLLRTQTGSRGPGTVKIPGKVGTKGRFLPQNVRTVDKLGPHQPVYTPTWLGRDPLVQGAGWGYKALTSPTATGMGAKALRFATSPSVILPGGFF